MGQIHYKPEWSPWTLVVSDDNQPIQRLGKAKGPKVMVDDNDDRLVSIRCTDVYCKETGRKTRHRKIPVAHIVLEAFGKTRTSLAHKACHEDDRPENNSLSNLYWGTEGDQARDRVQNRGRNARGKPMYLIPWLFDALRQFHKDHYLDGDLPGNHRALAENLIRDFLNQRWPEWIQWIREQQATQ